MAIRRSRRTLWSLALVVVLLNMPLLLSLATSARVASSGTDVVAEVIGGRVYGDADDPEYWLSYRFDADVDVDREAFSAEVDRATYTRARETRELSVEVVPGDPAVHRVEGAEPRRLGLLLTLGTDAVVLLLGLVWWLRRRSAPGSDSDPVPQSSA
ncbi:hypothetical protein [Nocardioides sp. LHG3406-4]|uniref:hypothetical protein n=1 Tax=Nocardioides sp. LHG3406-4 TaxID=2804575 RepID=UPI003CE77EB7